MNHRMRRAGIDQDSQGQLLPKAWEGALGHESFFLPGFLQIISSSKAELAPNFLRFQGSSLPKLRTTRMGKITDLSWGLARPVGMFVSNPAPPFSSCETSGFYSPLQASALLSIKWSEQQYLLH